MEKNLKKLQEIYKTRIENNNVLLPRIIHVETRSRCNSPCSFCPASIGHDPRKDVSMPLKLINKIINELSTLDYSSRLSFYNNNEPFMDNRIFDIIKLARKKLPKIYLELKTNGLLLDVKKIIDIFNNGLDTLHIHAYSKDKNLPKKIKAIDKELSCIRRFKGYLDKEKYYSRIIIICGPLNAVKRNRAGTSPNKPFLGKPLHRSCFRPFEMMTINPEGKISTCSEDFHYSILMGNIKNEKLLDIWNSEKWNELREMLANGDRSCKTACSRCDYKGFSNEMLKDNGLHKEKMDVKKRNNAGDFFKLFK